MRCIFNVRLTWASSIYIPFTLKWHYCHVRLVDTQHNFEITYLHLNYTECRSSHQRCSIKSAALKNFAIFTEKYLCWSLFLNQIVGLRPATSLKKRFQHRCFPVNIFQNTYFEEHLRTAASRQVSCWNFATTHFAICNLPFSFAIVQRHNLNFENTSFILSFYM